MKKRIIAILISTVMVFQIAGCGSSNKDTKTNKKNKTESTESTKENTNADSKDEDSNTDSNSDSDSNSNTVSNTDSNATLSIDDLYGEWTVEGLGFRSNVYAMTDDELNGYVGKTITISNGQCTIFGNDFKSISYDVSTMTPSELDSNYNTQIGNTIFGDKYMTIIKVIDASNSEADQMMAYDKDTLFYYVDGVAMKLKRK